jgi:serine phosphatase RsbU (regulator of sigma subunit)/anti-sigma regulatory factor (Ser/Thr protein kinase)
VINSDADVRKVSLRLKLTIIFIGISVLAVTLTALATFQKSQQALETEAFRKLTAIREMKANQIEDFFRHIEGQIRLLSEDDSVSSAILKFQKGAEDLAKAMPAEKIIRERLQTYYKNEFISRMPSSQTNRDIELFLPNTPVALSLQTAYIADNPYPVGEKDYLSSASGLNPYGRAHKKYHPFFKDFIKEFGFYDLFLIDLQGTIVYSVFKEIDLGTSLLSGPYKNTKFADVFRKALNTKMERKVFFSDFEPYAPSYNAPAAFVASPVFMDGQKIGVIALQFPIDHINEIMTDGYNWKNVGLGNSGETYLVGPDYRLRNQSRFLIEAPEDFFPQIESIDSTKASVESIREQNTTIGLLPVNTKGTEAALKGKTGTEVFADYRGIPVLSSYRPLNLKGLKWVIMSEIDASEAFSPISQLRQTAFLIALGIVFAVVIIAILTARSIAKPLLTLDDFTKDLADVDFRKAETEKLIEKIQSIMSRGDEVGDLARAFAALSSNLESSVCNLIDVETEKERMSSELSIAANIQMSMLPLIFPRFPEHKDIDVWAKLRPAREVGGDFYDFFFMDETHFGFVIADVSGKGAPAALLMAVTKTLLKANAQDVLSTSIILERINKELSENNDECMFVTLFFGILDVTTGVLTYTNAGHNPVHLLNIDGKVDILSEVHGPMVGAMPGIKYEQEQLRLEIDSKLILYTDGVTEAFNNLNEAFGNDRLLAYIEQSNKLGTKYIVNGIFDAVDLFAGGAEQSDDITVFCLRYVAWECREDAVSINLQLKNKLTEIDRALQSFTDFCKRAHLTEDIQNSVSIVLDDLLNNIINYAFEDSEEREIEVSFSADKQRMIIDVVDDGVEFDPFIKDEPDIESDIDERGLGGLGIHMIKSIMDDYFYRRIKGRNHITLMQRMGG